MVTLSSLEQRVDFLEVTLRTQSGMMGDILGLNKSTLEIVTSIAQNLGSLSDTVNTKLGHSSSLTVFDALEDFKERLERIEGKLYI